MNYDVIAMYSFLAFLLSEDSYLLLPLYYCYYDFGYCLVIYCIVWYYRIHCIVLYCIVFIVLYYYYCYNYVYAYYVFGGRPAAPAVQDGMI